MKVMLWRMAQDCLPIDGATDEDATVFTITAWHIWEARNAV